MVKTGLDVLIKSHLKLFQSKRIGIISNPSGVTFDLVQNVDALKAAGAKVTAIYAPEHGFRAAAKEGEKVDTYVDDITGITVYSLYGKDHKPSKEMLKDVDWHRENDGRVLLRGNLRQCLQVSQLEGYRVFT